MDVKRTLFRLLRNKLFAGLIILIPIVLTVKVLWWLFQYLDDLTRPLVTRLLGREIPGVGFATTIVVMFLTGLLFSSGPLRRLLESLEDVLEGVPMVGTVYSTIKKVLSGFGSPGSRKVFQRFVLAKLPGRMAPGFVTGSFAMDRSDGTSESYYAVYVPTNHLYVGDILLLSSGEVLSTDLSVEDGISVVLSAGAAIPARIGANPIKRE